MGTDKRRRTRHNFDRCFVLRRLNATPPAPRPALNATPSIDPIETFVVYEGDAEDKQRALNGKPFRISDFDFNVVDGKQQTPSTKITCRRSHNIYIYKFKNIQINNGMSSRYIINLANGEWRINPFYFVAKTATAPTAIAACASSGSLALL